jgi:hypothetical protein
MGSPHRLVTAELWLCVGLQRMVVLVLPGLCGIESCVPIITFRHAQLALLSAPYPSSYTFMQCISCDNSLISCNIPVCLKNPCSHISSQTHHNPRSLLDCPCVPAAWLYSSGVTASRATQPPATAACQCTCMQHTPAQPLPSQPRWQQPASSSTAAGQGPAAHTASLAATAAGGRRGPRCTRRTLWMWRRATWSCW